VQYLKHEIYLTENIFFISYFIKAINKSGCSLFFPINSLNGT
jgi:hypothetical protein